MDAELISRQLRGVQEKHKDDKIPTFGLCVSDMARDAADTIDELLAENKRLKDNVYVGVDLAEGHDFSVDLSGNHYPFIPATDVDGDYIPQVPIRFHEADE